VEVPPQGAKLVIIKAGQNIEPAVTEQPAAIPEAKAPEPTVVAAVATPTIEAKIPETTLPVDKIDNPRIVIIRRKPEEMTEVPLADETRAESAA
jgi:hypothetical protein